VSLDENERSGKRRETGIFPWRTFESGKIAINPGWLKEIWGRWPGDETIEELLVALGGLNGVD
jgi:hypothetical protein